VTVPAGTTQAASTFVVHITSTTTSATGGDCPGSGTVDNTGSVTSSNAGGGQSGASACVQGQTDLQITKAGAPADQQVQSYPGGSVTWTIVVTNKGPLTDTNVKVGDAMPFNTSFVSVTTTQGVCTGAAMLSCSLGTLKNGDSVTITLVTTPLNPGTITNTATVTGDLAETDYTNNTATASVTSHGPGKPRPSCTAVMVKPMQLYVGRSTIMHLKVTKTIQGEKKHTPVKGVRVRITGPGIRMTTSPTNSQGRVTKALTPRHTGIVTFKPIATKACKVPRVGITGVFTPPVTG
jgi:uncharacterized repeat protein (TIGR01451 family)